MAVHLEVVVDVADADRAVAFWSAALGYEPYGSFFQYRSLVDPDGVGPKLVLQEVADAKEGKNRVHLDLHVADVEAEVARLESLGATRLDGTPIVEAGTHWVRMADPDGNELCVVRLRDDAG
jgi:predicted enzyme related to lactoylglutathione lyase